MGFVADCLLRLYGFSLIHMIPLNALCQRLFDIGIKGWSIVQSMSGNDDINKHPYTYCYTEVDTERFGMQRSTHYNECYGVSDDRQQRSRLFRLPCKKTLKRIWLALFEEIHPVTGGFHSSKASNFTSVRLYLPSAQTWKSVHSRGQNNMNVLHAQIRCIFMYKPNHKDT